MNISMRLHAMIFSLSMGTPVLAINYEPKVRNVMSSFGLPELLVDPGENLGPALIAAVERCRGDLPGVRERIKERLAVQKVMSAQTFHLLRGLMGITGNAPETGGARLHTPGLVG